MKIPEISVEKMKEIDRLMVEELNIEIMQMMENAGRNIAAASIKLFKPQRVSILAGKGNNGGDGIAAARHLKNRGIEVEIILGHKNLRKLAKKQLESAEKFKIPIKNKISGKPDLIIDTLLGYQATGEPRGKIAELIEEANRLNVPVLSVDIPTGFDVTNNIWHAPSFENATVLTIGLPKTNMNKNKKIKNLYLMDIGIPSELYKKVGINVPMIFKKDYVIKVN